MKVIRPIDVTDAILTSIDVPETDHAVWNSGTTYNKGDYCISTTTHTVYRSLLDSNLNNDPDVEAAAFADPLVEDPATQYWQVFSATNRWKLFDGKPSVQTSQTNGFTVTLTPGKIISGVAAFNVYASEINITMESAAVEVYSATVQMTDETVVIDGWTYYFAEIQVMPYFVLTDLPPYPDATITVEFVGSGAVLCGQLVVGPIWDLGYVELGNTGFEGIDFSTVETDVYGNLTTVEREATTLHRFDIVLGAQQLLGFENRMRDLKGGKRAVWIGDELRSKAALNYGFYRYYKTLYSEGDESLIQIEVQGVV